MTSIAVDTPFQLVARDRPELEAAHAQMIAWATARRDQVDVDVDVENTALELAVTNGWLIAPFTRRLNVLGRQRTFYEKILAALQAGYAIVPNFQMQVFAIRTQAKAPRQTERRSSYQRNESFVQPAQLLAAGEGHYVNPSPLIVTNTTTKKNAEQKDVTEYVYSPDDVFQDVEFPIALATPVLMTRVGEAMALKLFDEVGVAVDTWDRRRGGGRGDPILLGRLLNPRTGRASLTFFLAWAFDPSRL